MQYSDKTKPVYQSAALLKEILGETWVSCNSFSSNPCGVKSVEYPGDSRSWESPEKADNVSLLFIQILLR